MTKGKGRSWAPLVSVEPGCYRTYVRSVEPEKRGRNAESSAGGGGRASDRLPSAARLFEGRPTTFILRQSLADGMAIRNPRLWALGLAAMMVVGGGAAAFLFLYEGSLAVYVRDAPGGWAHVYVAFSAVSIHESGKGNASWVALSIAAGTVDLASLTNVSAFLASTRLAPGHFEQLRIDVSSASGVTSTGQTVAFTVPSGDLKTDEQFEIVSGKTTTLTLDVDLGHSIVKTSTGWIFTPVIGSVALS